MNLQSVTLARAIAFIEVTRLDPHGQMFLPEVVQAIAERYSFQKRPLEPKNLSISDGIEFETGTYGGTAIRKLAIYGQIVYLDTVVSTELSQALLLEFFRWLEESRGATFDVSYITRWGFVSDIVCQSDFDMLNWISPALTLIGAAISGAIAANLGEHIEFAPSELHVGHDPQLRVNAIAPFTIQYRINHTRSENVFFTEAPMQTFKHYDLLKELEAHARANHESR